jgi:thioredoxin 1
MSESDDLEELRQLKREQLLNQDGSTLGQSGTPTEPVHITDQSHFQEVTQRGLVVVDFYADWCGPCQMLEPTLEDIARDHPVTVAKVDIDQHQHLAQQHGVRSVPTLVFYSDGEVVEQLLGVQDHSTLTQLISQYT